MRRIGALAVIGEHLDDPALADGAVPPVVDHPGHLAAQGRQPGDAVVDFRQVPPGNGIGIGAGLGGIAG